MAKTRISNHKTYTYASIKQTIRYVAYSYEIFLITSGTFFVHVCVCLYKML